MAIGAIIQGILPVSLVILTVFLLFRSHRLPFSMRVADSSATHPADRKKIFKYRKTSAVQAKEDDWELTFQAKPAFTDSCGNIPSQNAEAQFSFTDSAARRIPEKHEQRFT